MGLRQSRRWASVLALIVQIPVLKMAWGATSPTILSATVNEAKSRITIDGSGLVPKSGVCISLLPRYERPFRCKIKIEFMILHQPIPVLL